MGGAPVSTATLDDDVPLADARDWLRERVDDGEHCPCCRQLAKVYRRKLSVAAARTMVLLYRFGGQVGKGYIDLPRLLEAHAPELSSQGGYATLGHWWGLIERMPGERDDGSKHNGLWRLTVPGIDFVERRTTVPKYARIYDGRCLGYAGPEVDIDQVLGTRFRYDELMAGV